jgi:hypothetical protein
VNHGVRSCSSGGLYAAAWASGGQDRREVVGNRRLEIDYQILDDSLDEDSAIRLIKRTILRVSK